MIATTGVHRRFATRMNSLEVSTIREILKVTEMPDVISFAGGLPAPELFPSQAMARAFYQVLSEEGASALQYSTTEGFAPLRQWIAERMGMRGLRTVPQEIMITSGSQQGLDLVARVLLNAGDKVLVARPTYLAAIQTFSLFEARFVTVGSDDQGMNVEEAAEQIERHPEIRLVYLVPNFQNPSGTTLTLERRRRLLEVCRQSGVRILEDDPYGELRYRGQTLPSIKSMDDSGLVIYLSTFSKIMAPGMRLGWVIAEPETYQQLVIAKQATDLHTNTVAQRAAHRYLCDNSADDHISRIRSVYGERCQAMLDSLSNSFPRVVRWTSPEGGMFVWVELPEEVNAEELLAKAIREKIAFVPGAPFFADQRRHNFMRLNFSNQSIPKIAEGIARLATVLNRF
jgi:2-aminoadipate transaminase